MINIKNHIFPKFKISEKIKICMVKSTKLCLTPKNIMPKLCH